MGFKTVQLSNNNAVTGLYSSYLINIAADGTFEVALPLTREQEVWVGFPFFNSPIYLEPGKELIQNFDITSPSAVTSVFKGVPATVNNDINKVRPILMDFDWDAIDKAIYSMTPEQYKLYFQQIQQRKLSQIDSIAKKGAFNKTAYDLAQRNVKYSTADLLIFYRHMMESAYRHVNKLSFDNKQPLSKPVKPDSSYYSFLKELKYNDPLALRSYNYFILINRLMYMEPVYDQARTEGADYEKELAILKTKDTSDLGIKNTINHYEEMIARNATIPGALERARPVVFKKLLPVSSSMETDIVYLQSITREMDINKDTLSAEKLATIKSNVKNPFLLADVYTLDNTIKESIRNAKTQKGYSYNQLAATTANDSMLTTILEKYKGKVIFIDFWATWCGPCMDAIKRIAPLKEELAGDKNIVFLYITNTSSPEKSYDVIMPGIKGEHYRLSTDQFNQLSGMFNIVGIPHYAIVDKRGTIINKNFIWTQNDQVKEQLLRLEKE
ncbi:TlpA family protein disulfide reductase [Chitinophaga pinensis]|nr:TlpA disulfide reductase family protein [Chitinophaga pinensis]